MRRNKWLILAVAGATLLCGCSNVQKPQDEEERTLVEEKQTVLSDGTRIDVWRLGIGTADIYGFSDGTELLIVYDTIGPENVSVRTVSFADMSAAAQRRVRLYYEEQGLLYDVQEELEKAYQEYLACQQNNQTYSTRAVMLEITPSAYNDRYISFITTLGLPLGNQMMGETRFGAIFDRETGEQIDLWSMFTAPQETVMERLLEVGNVTDPTQYAEMAAAFHPKYVLFFPDYLTVEFHAEEMPHADADCSILASYSELADILQDWAVPDAL